RFSRDWSSDVCCSDLVTGRRTLAGMHTPGVNIVGYHHVDSGLGEIARALTRSFRAAGVAVTEVTVTATDSPVRGEPPAAGELHRPEARRVGTVGPGGG